jgi:hypothetical protein
LDRSSDTDTDTDTDADAGKHADNYSHENAEAEVYADANTYAGGRRHPEAVTDQADSLTRMRGVSTVFSVAESRVRIPS